MNETARLALGSAQWGAHYGIVNTRGVTPPGKVRAILDVARRAGITVIDTARAYGSEAVIGHATSGDCRWRVVTKVAADVVGRGDRFTDAVSRLGTSLDESRRALRRSTLDTVLLHRTDHRRAFDGGLWRALLEHQARGHIGRVGVSVTSAADAMTLLEEGVECLQVPASLLDMRLWRAGFFDQAREAGVEVFVRSVFLQGVAFLEPSKLPPRLQSLAGPLERVGRWAKSAGVPVGTAFLGFMKATVTAPLILGCEDSAQLTEHLGAWSSVEFSRGDIDDLASLVPESGDEVLNPAKW